MGTIDWIRSRRPGRSAVLWRNGISQQTIIRYLCQPVRWNRRKRLYQKTQTLRLVFSLAFSFLIGCLPNPIRSQWKLFQVDKVWKIPADGPQTLLECFQLGLKLSGPNGTICGTPSTDGKYQLKTYGDMEADSMLIGSALDYYGLIGARGGSFFEFSVGNLGGRSRAF